MYWMILDSFLLHLVNVHILVISLFLRSEFVYLFVCPFVCLSVFLSICLSVPAPAIPLFYHFLSVCVIRILLYIIFTNVTLQEKDSRTVCQFQYTDWPDTGLPDSGVGIVDLIGQVQKWQQQSGNTAIVLHCR